ncbi:beta-defensin 133 [Grammomys surdaster]|uniref:beta-defensin 133 n=1 Tax=Grammomys surdaster TaxID=491861 RepID=UPI00109F3F31|nr:beta-defensin 133 [Grammomys surdaster]
MKLPVLFLLFFFLDLLRTVKADLKDTYFCFIKKGKCRHVCSTVKKRVGACTKLNANCCIVMPEDQSTVSIKISNKDNWVPSPPTHPGCSFL